MYKLILNQIVKDNKDESYPLIFVVNDLERALALASLFQKISTPEVQFVGITVEPFI